MLKENMTLRLFGTGPQIYFAGLNLSGADGNFTVSKGGEPLMRLESDVAPPAAAPEYDFSSESIVLVHGAGSSSFFATTKAALEAAGAVVTAPDLKISYAGVYEVDATVEACVEILVAVVEAAYLSNNSQPVSMVCHSMGGIWGTYAATDTRLTGKVKRIVFAGAPIPDVAQSEGYYSRSGGALVSARDFPLLPNNMDEFFESLPPALWQGPAALTGTNNPTSSLDGKVSILHQEEDWSLGVNLSGNNTYMSEAPSQGIKPLIDHRPCCGCQPLRFP